MQTAYDRVTGELVRVGDIALDVWMRDYQKRRPLGDGRWRLACPGCGADVSGWSSSHPLAQRPPRFTHRPDSAPCAWADESELHRRTKAAILAAATAAGWSGDVEVPGRGYRADVLVEQSLAVRGPDGVIGRPNVVHTTNVNDGATQRVAFEVQLSRQGPLATSERSARYAGAGVEVVWLLRWRGVRARQHPGAVELIASGQLEVDVPTAGGVSRVCLTSFVHDVLAEGLRRAPAPTGFGLARAPAWSERDRVVVDVSPAPGAGVVPTPTPVVDPPVVRRERAERRSFWGRLAELLFGRAE